MMFELRLKLTATDLWQPGLIEHQKFITRYWIMRAIRKDPLSLETPELEWCFNVLCITDTGDVVKLGADDIIICAFTLRWYRVTLD